MVPVYQATHSATGRATTTIVEPTRGVPHMISSVPKREKRSGIWKAHIRMEVPVATHICEFV